jgi:Uma2 family endonuclease
MQPPYICIMALAKTDLVTADDYQLLPETGPRYQLIEGELFMAPAPNRFHQDISRNLEFVLLKYLERNPIGKLYHAPFDVYLSEHNVFQPDIIFVAKNRYNIFIPAGAEGAPNFVVEILSPRTAHLDTDLKPKIYKGTGVEELWIIDPKAKTIAIYYLQRDAEKPAAVFGETDQFTSPHFPGLDFQAKEIFKQ